MTTHPTEAGRKVRDEIARLIVEMANKIEVDFPEIPGTEIANILLLTGLTRICADRGREDTLAMLDGTSSLPNCETPNKMPAEITQQSAEAVHKIFTDSLVELGKTLHREYPQYSAMLPRAFLWVGAHKIGLDAGHDTAAEVFEEMAGAIRNGALDPAAPDVPSPTRVLQ